MSFASPYFLTWVNMRAMTMAFAVEGIVVVGMTILLISGGIDLSVGSVTALAMVIAGLLFLNGVDPWTASAIAIAACAGIGAMMGLLKDISAISVRPALVIFDLVRGDYGLKDMLRTVKLDLADLNQHVTIEKETGFWRQFRLTPDDLEEFISAVEKARAALAGAPHGKQAVRES
jgi:predicted ABC-type sugar transport system permease subunit